MSSDLEKSVEVVAEAWKDSPYYEDAERWTWFFWDETRAFRPWFDRLDPRNILELACGHGRHSEVVAPMAPALTVMDVHQENIDACRRRLAGFSSVTFIQNDGYDYQPVADASITSIFCYDAMVHFSADLIESYLRDSARVLVPGGMALFHHSNHDAGTTQHYGLNPCARNAMTLERFNAMTIAAGLEPVASRTLDWGGFVDLDGLSLVRRPGEHPRR